MKVFSIWMLVIAQTLSSAVHAAEPRVPQARQTPASPQAPRAWLGIRVAKPDEGITAQVPSLPPGIGFTVKSMDDGGPAKAAGLMELDLLWKIGDQMLVNEAQLATLLRLYEPGQEVVISGFRGGKPIEVKLRLGVAPELTKPFPGEMVESAILPGSCGGPMRIVNVADKSASFSADGCIASVRREGEIFKVRIDGPKSEVIYEGELAKEGNLEQIPVPWRRRIEILCRTLDQALSGTMLPERQPRPRVVPPPALKP
jgi:hypothetical protein